MIEELRIGDIDPIRKLVFRNFVEWIEISFIKKEKWL